MKLVNIIKIAWWAYRNPIVMNNSNFKMLSDLLGLLLKVAKESRPYMTRIAYIHPDTKELSDIVAIWAGAGLGADPLKRIEELQKEICRLKAQLLDKINTNITV